MPLFHPKTLTKSLTVSAIPERPLAIITDWADSITSQAIYSQKETALSGQFVQKILVDLLGYTHFSDNHQQWNITREQQLAKGSVDVALGRFTADSSQVLVPFELKGAKTKELDAIMPGRHKSPVQQAWEYAMDAPGAQWVMVSNFVEIRLYAIGYGRQDYEVWQLQQLADPAEYARFMALLCAENLLGGKTRQLLEASDKAEKEITNRLYDDYRNLRLKLITTLEHDNPATPTKTVIPLAQTLLDRILFVAFAEDRGLLPDKILQQAYQHSDPFNPRPIWENFIGLFRAIDKGNRQLNIPAYNGGLFAENRALDSLNVSDSLCEGFKELGEYDFESEVSVNVLGHIFEQSISDLEAIHEAIEEGKTLEQSSSKQSATTGKRKQHGVVYTPDGITRFIVEQTLGSYIDRAFSTLLTNYTKGKKAASEEEIVWKNKKAEQQFWRQWREQLIKIKIVDPACGSGAFLVAAFDYLHAEYSRINEKLLDLTGTIDLFDLDKEILTNNLYGVDINGESVEISKLSLWLKTAKRGKALTSLDSNIRQGNSLVFKSESWATGNAGAISSIPVVPDHKPQQPCEPDCRSNFSSTSAKKTDSFSWQTAFPQLFQQGGFDVVLGNPPYVRQERFSDQKPFLQQNFAVYHGVVDLYAYFYELGLKLLKPGGQLGYISSSTFFKTGSGEPLRRHLSQQSQLETIIDFGDLQLFEGVTTYPAIVIARQQQADSEHSLSILNITEKKLPEELSAYFHQHRQSMRQQQLNPQSWRLESKTLAQLRQKLTTGHATLKEVYGSPYRGVLTGFNEAFVIDRTTRDRLIAEDPSSATILKPFLEGKDLKKWHSEPGDLWLIFTRRGIDIEQYPAILKHLSAFKERLTPKPKAWPQGEKWGGRKSGPYQWYEIQDTVAYYEKFEQPKIFYPDISQGSKFSLDNTARYTVNTVYFVPNSDPFLLAVLNSPLIWFFMKGISDALRGGTWRIRMFSEKIETIPIPKATNLQKQSLGLLAEQCQQLAEARYAVEQSVRQRIPDLCPEGRDSKLSKKLIHWWQLDFAAFRKEIKRLYKTDIPLSERNEWENWLAAETDKISQQSQQLKENEKKLNEQVYVLFKLNSVEIALIEAALLD